MSPAFYRSSIETFIEDNESKIVGTLTSRSGSAGFYQQLHTQTRAWEDQIRLLQRVFKEVAGTNPKVLECSILFEYTIARRSKRIDVVFLSDVVTVIEFKIGQTKYSADDVEQLMDYCLDLRDFHFESRSKLIFPILVATKSSEVKISNTLFLEQIQPLQAANASTLAQAIAYILTIKKNDFIDASKWENSAYSPTPTIIEAAQTLYAGKSVAEISRSHAGTKNLTKTTDAVINAILQAKDNHEKIVCFITGVPGAGKTLAGLNIAHHTEFQNEMGSSATFLSGNGPLISVLREALARDAVKRNQKIGNTTKKKEQERTIAFIENVHKFLDAYFFDKKKVPNNHIVIFDEAQRAWNAEQSERKFNRPYSEAEMLFEIMERHNDWAVVVALVGGGQEINTGEAGLPEWGNVLMNKFPNWKIFVSNDLSVGDGIAGNLTLFKTKPKSLTIIENPDLHLDVSLRSYKAEALSQWVNCVLNNDANHAKKILQENLKNYPLVITRELEKAKEWLRANCSGSRRMGMVASSGARRIRPYGLDVKNEFEASNWFLNSKNDVRSSSFLEVAATEFGIQGLELDWVGLCWDADLRRTDGEWDFRNFSGTKWQNVSSKNDQTFILNTYRVLLTRAREGMVIWIPPGENGDETRLPEFYDTVFEYLKSCGLLEIN